MSTSRRLPIPLVDAELSRGGFIAEAVFIPRAEVSELPRFGDPWEPLSSRRLRKDVDAGLRGLYGINDNGLSLELFGEYALGDHWKIGVGV
jgi:hypothetical protein